MGLPEQKNEPFDQYLNRVDKLSPSQLEQLRLKVNSKSWGFSFQKLCEEIEVNRIAKGLPLLSDEEINAEVAAARKELKDQRAQNNR